MDNINKLKGILYRKAKLENKRSLDVNLGEISREIGCSSKEVESILRYLQAEKEIKALIQVGFSKEDYTLTILENSSILNH